MFLALKKMIAAMVAIIMTITGYLDFADVIIKPDAVMAEYYVSVNGDDNNVGTCEAPFATIERARDEARKLTADMSGDIIIHIEEGTYTLEDTLTFNEKDCGTNGYGVKYIGNNAVISGGTEISDFTLYDSEKNIYAAKVPDGMNFRQVYVDGEKIIRSRSNSDYSTRIIGASR
ncbi:MAG: hypothetical protein IKY78_06405, partial [Clostridia bacterium]|nr:hypothetical protein [Clostridia bacterium]